MSDNDAHDFDPGKKNEGAWARGGQFFTSQRGTRQISLSALIERVSEQFEAEYGDDSPALREAVTRTDKLKLVREVVLYVVGVESVHLSPTELAGVIQASFGELFGYGGLEKYFSDFTFPSQW